MFHPEIVTLTDQPYVAKPPAGGVDALPGCSLIVWHQSTSPVTIGGPLAQSFPVAPNLLFPMNDMDPDEYPSFKGTAGTTLYLLWQGIPNQAHP